jgi:alkaline phosphatase D
MTRWSGSRRAFLGASGTALGAAALPGWVGAVARAAEDGLPGDGSAPQLLQGIQIGDVRPGRAVLWSRSDRPARLRVEYALSPSFAGAVRIAGPHALSDTDYTARVDLAGLPPDRRIFVRVSFEDLSNAHRRSEVASGEFRTPPEGKRDLRFVWGGDTAGQGWGINPDLGGMRIYETMRQAAPDFFVHSGDNIYADGPIAETATAENGQLWRNRVTPEVSKVAESLGEFRGRYRYNLLDENLRRFNAEVPQIWQWDDHEVLNNWSPAKDLSGDARYTEKNVPLLAARGLRAFLEYAPLRDFDLRERERVYRRIPYGERLEVFVLDMRSYRGGNSANRQSEPGPDTACLGSEQLEWLKRGLADSRATWKVIAADMPLGLQVTDGTDAEGQTRYEALANGDGPVLGREFELADLLAFLKRERVRNTLWITADVHYCAAHFYDPRHALFRDFDPFWEFVAGPLNAGTFGPNALDDSFGPQVVFQRAPEPGQSNLSPLAKLQFFGQVDIEGRSGALTVALRNLDGDTLFSRTLRPAR